MVKFTKAAAILALVASCAVFAQTSGDAIVLDCRGIRIEFDSAERGFDCLAIKNKLGGKAVHFSDGASDGKSVGLWALESEGATFHPAAMRRNVV